MTWTLQQVPTQSGRVAIVTGANIGLGFEVALALAAKNCSVVMACRNRDKAEAAKARILARHPGATLECMALDLASLRSVHAFAAAFGKRFERLDLLINNAGIMMPPYALSEDGFESQLAANYLGHFALTGLLLPRIVQTPHSRIVSLSSLAHHWGDIQFDDPQSARGYDKRRAYGQSKLACLMFAYELQRRLARAGHGTLSVAAHPGVSATNLFQHLPVMLHPFAPLVGLVFNTAAGGALPVLYAALGDDIEGGDYCGPQSFRQMRGAPVKVGSNRRSRDVAAAARLWNLSQDLTGVRFLEE
ncbi:oxidoreductase [Rhodoferax saidenbachensis]|uniref:Short-chain dehydrogenase n=1 Tax=Rhodoferax saidenbachensis TaxID=1484693 RepID=A0A1P8KF27_9BURK|nr:oxidoreductase [Rhodoferax saidenbachensis]APW44566.1 short-chain dehydrogenase [Rhodoferax saidenbachensis]